MDGTFFFFVIGKRKSNPTLSETCFNTKQTEVKAGQGSTK